MRDLLAAGREVREHGPLLGRLAAMGRWRYCHDQCAAQHGWSRLHQVCCKGTIVRQNGGSFLVSLAGSPPDRSRCYKGESSIPESLADCEVSQIHPGGPQRYYLGPLCEMRCQLVSGPRKGVQESQNRTLVDEFRIVSFHPPRPHFTHDAFTNFSRCHLCSQLHEKTS